MFHRKRKKGDYKSDLRGDVKSTLGYYFNSQNKQKPLFHNAENIPSMYH